MFTMVSLVYDVHHKITKKDIDDLSSHLGAVSNTCEWCHGTDDKGTFISVA